MAIQLQKAKLDSWKMGQLHCMWMFELAHTEAHNSKNNSSLCRLSSNNQNNCCYSDCRWRFALRLEFEMLLPCIAAFHFARFHRNDLFLFRIQMKQMFWSEVCKSIISLILVKCIGSAFVAKFDIFFCVSFIQSEIQMAKNIGNFSINDELHNDVFFYPFVWWRRFYSLRYFSCLRSPHYAVCSILIALPHTQKRYARRFDATQHLKFAFFFLFSLLFSFMWEHKRIKYNV